MKIAQLDLTNSRYFDLPFQSEISLNSDCSKSFDSFHNSFFESYWSNYTTLKNVSLSIELSGVGSLELIRVCNNQEKILDSQNYSSDHKQAYSFHFAITSSENSRVFIKVNTTKETIISNNAYWYTDDTPAKIVKLAMIMCTFNKQDYILKNLENLFTDEDFKNSSSEIFVVDNASNLNLEESDKLHYVPQENYGGAGGFTRGLIEAKATKRFTHYLFMDDDIELDPDTITRAISYAAFFKRDYALSGSMLCLNDKNTLWESGANFLTSTKYMGPDSHFHNQKLTQLTLDKISRPYDFEYGAWWFCMFSDNAVNSVGLPYPLFIRGDDIEYGLRLKQNGFKTINLPGIAVWHETFHHKTSLWLTYYNFRNFTLIWMIYFNIKKSYQSILKILKLAITDLYLFNYSSNSVLLRSLKHLVFGSIPKESTPKSQKRLINFLKDKQTETKEKFEEENIKSQSFLNLIKNLLTFNQHLFAVDHSVITKVHHENWKRKTLLNNNHTKLSAISITNTYTGKTDTYYKKPKLFFIQLFKTVILFLFIFPLLPLIKICTRIKFRTYRTLKFWKKFLKIS